MTEAQLTALYRDCGQEVATHGLTHPFLERLPLNVAAYEIMKDCGKEAGYFGMQDHGDEVWYRNIRVKVLK